MEPTSSGMDRAQLADFLRTRRAALQPEDVGLPAGQRRRTEGLRREEVAQLALMSTDYYGRIEQQRGPQPSEQMVASIARALRLSQDERDHLFRIAGHATPARGLVTNHVDPGLMRVLDRLSDTPAQVMSAVSETLVQTAPCVALLGSANRWTGLAASMVYRWFTEPEARAIYPEEDHPWHSRVFTADLRGAYTRLGQDSRAGEIVARLLDRSPEFQTLWSAHEVGLKRSHRKRIISPEVGLVEVDCQQLFDLDQSQGLLVFTATPGTESYEKLKLLAVIGAQYASTAS